MLREKNVAVMVIISYLLDNKYHIVNDIYFHGTHKNHKVA